MKQLNARLDDEFFDELQARYEAVAKANYPVTMSWNQFLINSLNRGSIELRGEVCKDVNGVKQF